MNKILRVISILLLLLLITGCSGSDGTKGADQSADSSETKLEKTSAESDAKKVEEGMCTLDQAIDSLKDQVQSVVGKSDYRLAKIEGNRVESNGYGPYWKFLYVKDDPESDSYLMKYFFVWRKGEIETYDERLFSTGLNTSDYDYYWKDASVYRIDPSEIVASSEKEYKEVDENGYSLELYWDTSICEDAPVWYVDSHHAKWAELYYNGISGKLVTKMDTY